MGIHEPGPRNTTVLRDVAETDLSVLFEFQKDPDAGRMAAFVPRDPTDRVAFFAHWQRILADPTVISKVILWNGDIVGSVGSFSLGGGPQVTYWIGKEFWGKGIATQALTALLSLVCSRPIYSSVAFDNIASIRVLEKCGFARTGEARAFAKARGVEIEEVFFELAG